ncbi:Ig-like domain repeat protein, partial [Candidatus Aerophobetes bacterium]|nr:Ig-like domain repeat protein [Candidatus Aerophobetes bacterium]
STPDSPLAVNNHTAIREQITSLEVVFTDEGSGIDIASCDVVLVAPDASVIEGEVVEKEENYVRLNWSLISLPLNLQGRYIIRVSAKDKNGNTEEFANYEFVYDRLAPVVVSTFPTHLSTLTSPLTRVTVQVTEDTTQTDEVAGVDIENCFIELMDENMNVITSGGNVESAQVIALEAEPGEYLVSESGFYFIKIKLVDYAGNIRYDTRGFYLQLDPVQSVLEASLDAEGTDVYEIKDSTDPVLPSCFANSMIDTVYVKILLNEGIYLDESESSISLLRVERVQTGNVEGEEVEGSARISCDIGQGIVEFFFYPASIFDPDKDEGTKDGLYWVKVNVVDRSGNTGTLSFFFVYDTTPPQPPQFSIKSFNSDTGILTLEGTTVPDSSDPQCVEVFINGVSAATTQAEEDGSFSLDVELVSGENSITLRTKDKAGNFSEFTAPLKFAYHPERLLSVIFRSSKILRQSSLPTPVKLIYCVSEPAKVQIRIYNLLGEIVYDWQEEVSPGEEEEWCWWGENMFGREVNNGVYIMSIRAKSSTREEKVVKLVGVLR